LSERWRRGQPKLEPARSVWVSELIETAGGVEIFADRAHHASAKDSIVAAEDVLRAAPRPDDQIRAADDAGRNV
jgi:hypothetical protein